ncbi:MAG: hypothetical protein ABJA34_13875 [Pseudonocardiales bacterium]
MPSPIRTYLEVGKTWIFACALDWPGWCRRGRGEEGAIDALLDYADRYAVVAGSRFTPGEPTIVGRVPGNMTTDFGAPGVPGGWDAKPLGVTETAQHTGLLARCWEVFDEVVATAPSALPKGPRGGGRDRDAIVDHVREAERGYAPKVGVRVPPRTPWPQQRATLLEALRAGVPDARWPARYSIRRLAWHLLDHAWEIEDKST